MSDLIKREDAIKAVAQDLMYESCVQSEYASDELSDWIEVAKVMLEEVSSADRPQGKWIWSPRDTDGTVSGCCSNCSFSHLFIGGHTAQYNYCPSCGARMKGADDYERAIEQTEHDMLYEPTYNSEDGSM